MADDALPPLPGWKRAALVVRRMPDGAEVDRVDVGYDLDEERVLYKIRSLSFKMSASYYVDDSEVERERRRRTDPEVAAAEHNRDQFAAD